MQRRECLTTAGAAVTVAIAGCGETEEVGGDDPEGDLVSLVDHSLFDRTDDFGTREIGVEGQVENISDEELSLVTISVDFFDQDDVLIDQGLTSTISDLGAGVTAEFEVLYIGDEPDRIDDYDISVEVTDF